MQHGNDYHVNWNDSCVAWKSLPWNKASLTIQNRINYYVQQIFVEKIFVTMLHGNGSHTTQ